LSVVGESVVGSLAVEVKQKHDGKKLKQKPHNIVYQLQVKGDRLISRNNCGFRGSALRSNWHEAIKPAVLLRRVSQQKFP